MSKVGLLGTKYPMDEIFYTSRIEANDIQILLPDKLTVRKSTESFMKRSVLVNCRRRKSDLKPAKLGVECIILGCTEIGLLVKQEDAEITFLDTTVIHASRPQLLLQLRQPFYLISAKVW